MQRERRRDPYPWTWEPPAAAAACLLLLVVVGIQLGRAVANMLAGGGWTWPGTRADGGFRSPLGTAFWSSLPGVVDGRADSGLAAPAPTEVAGRPLLWTAIAVTELAVLVTAGWVLAATYRRWGPGRMRGMASPAGAEKLLGVTRLREVAPLVRPDVYSTRAPAPARAQAGIGDTREPGAATAGLGRGLNPWLPHGRTGRANRQGLR
jgi:hypothetical protein